MKVAAQNLRVGLIAVCVPWLLRLDPRMAEGDAGRALAAGSEDDAALVDQTHHVEPPAGAGEPFKCGDRFVDLGSGFRSGREKGADVLVVALQGFEVGVAAALRHPSGEAGE